MALIGFILAIDLLRATAPGASDYVKRGGYVALKKILAEKITQTRSSPSSRSRCCAAAAAPASRPA
jgi:hypothetical protein